MTRILFSVYEKSADFYAFRLAKYLKDNFYIWGFGGPELASRFEKIKDITEKSAVMGLPIFKLPFFIKVYGKMKKLIKKSDIIILVDFSGLNLKLLEFSRKYDKKIVYFIPPKFWVWGKDRINKLKKADAVFPLFGFEHDILKKNNVKSYYFGHPLYEELKNIPKKDKVKKRLGIFPGSRINEIKATLPKILKAIKYYDGERLLFVSDTNFEKIELINHYVEKCNFPVKLIMPDEKYEYMPTLDKAIACSGTVNLELSYFKVPTIVVYKLNPIVYRYFKNKIRAKYVSLPNIILNKEIFPELIQEKFNTVEIQSALQNINEEHIKKDCETIWNELSGENIYEKIASTIRGL